MQAVAETRPKPRLLFLDDEAGIVNTLKAIFRMRYEVFTATSPAEALDIVRRGGIHVVVSDQRMPQMQGVEFLGQVRDISPGSVRLLLTGYADLDATIEAVNSGEIFRYVTKPWNHQEIKDLIAEAAEIGLRTLAALPAGAPPVDTAEAAPTAEVLIVDDDRRVMAVVADILGDSARTRHASSVAQAIQLLGAHDVALVVADTQVHGEDTIAFLRVLKSQYPIIQIVMLADLTDSDLVIQLINKVRVYRVAGKPIRPGALRLSLLSALRQHATCERTPVLLAQQAVQAVPADEPLLAPLRQSIAGRLRSIVRRFKVFGLA